MRPEDRLLRLMLLGYNVGLSWSSALVDLEARAILDSVELDNTPQVSACSVIRERNSRGKRS